MELRKHWAQNTVSCERHTLGFGPHLTHSEQIGKVSQQGHVGKVAFRKLNLAVN